MRLLAAPERLSHASDLPPTPLSAHDTYYMRDSSGKLWVSKRLSGREIVAEAAAVLLAHSFGVEVAPGAYSSLASEWWWHSELLPYPVWDACFAERVHLEPLTRLVVFDIVLGIGDRHAGNVLLRPTSKGYWPIGIDHETAVVAVPSPDLSTDPQPPTHALPGLPVAMPLFQEQLLKRAEGIVQLPPSFPDLDHLQQDFRKFLPDVRASLELRCESAVRLVEQWIQINVRENL